MNMVDTMATPIKVLPDREASEYDTTPSKYFTPSEEIFTDISNSPVLGSNPFDRQSKRLSPHAVRQRQKQTAQENKNKLNKSRSKAAKNARPARSVSVRKLPQRPNARASTKRRSSVISHAHSSAAGAETTNGQAAGGKELTKGVQSLWGKMFEFVRGAMTVVSEETNAATNAGSSAPIRRGTGSRQTKRINRQPSERKSLKSTTALTTASTAHMAEPDQHVDTLFATGQPGGTASEQVDTTPHLGSTAAAPTPPAENARVVRARQREINRMSPFSPSSQQRRNKLAKKSGPRIASQRHARGDTPLSPLIRLLESKVGDCTSYVSDDDDTTAAAVGLDPLGVAPMYEVLPVTTKQVLADGKSKQTARVSMLKRRPLQEAVHRMMVFLP